MVYDMEEQGFMECNILPWTVTVIVVNKKDGTKNYCRSSTMTKSNIHLMMILRDMVRGIVGISTYKYLLSKYLQHNRLEVRVLTRGPLTKDTVTNGVPDSIKVFQF